MTQVPNEAQQRVLRSYSMSNNNLDRKSLVIYSEKWARNTGFTTAMSMLALQYVQEGGRVHVFLEFDYDRSSTAFKASLTRVDENWEATTAGRLVIGDFIVDTMDRDETPCLVIADSIRNAHDFQCAVDFIQHVMRDLQPYAPVTVVVNTQVVDDLFLDQQISRVVTPNTWSTRNHVTWRPTEFRLAVKTMLLAHARDGTVVSTLARGVLMKIFQFLATNYTCEFIDGGEPEPTGVYFDRAIYERLQAAVDGGDMEAIHQIVAQQLGPMGGRRR